MTNYLHSHMNSQTQITVFKTVYKQKQQMISIDWLTEHGFTSAPTQYRLYGRRFLQVQQMISIHHSVTDAN